MKYRQLIIANFCITLGTVLNIIVPPLFLGIKPDFLLIFFFLGFTFLSSWKDVLVLTFVGACFSALTSTIPGGILANFIDKIVVGPLFYISYSQFKKIPFAHAVCMFIGTLISGMIFLTVMMTMDLIPTPLLHMFFIAVLPTALFNTASHAMIQKYLSPLLHQKNSLSL